MQTFNVAETARRILNFEVMAFNLSLEELKQIASAISSLNLSPL